MTKRVALSLLVLCACRSGGPSPTPTAATSSAPPPVAATTASAENEWHAFKPAPTIGSEGWKGDPRPMYEWVNGDAGATCTVHVLKTGAFYTCGGSVARFDAARLDFEPFRALPVGTNLPVEVYGAWPDDRRTRRTPSTPRRTQRRRRFAFMRVRSRSTPPRLVLRHTRAAT